MSGRKPLFIGLTLVGIGAIIGCLQSANWIGAGVWAGCVSIFAWAAARSTYA